jgi:hypothetical protein
LRHFYVPFAGSTEASTRTSIQKTRDDSSDRRSLCNSLNDERGTGGQTKLAKRLGWHHSTLWRKLNGLSRITKSDELAIRQALVLEPPERLALQ